MWKKAGTGDHGVVRDESQHSNPDAVEPESTDPNDSERLSDKLKGETTEHAKPPRLEDEGQSGG